MREVGEMRCKTRERGMELILKQALVFDNNVTHPLRKDHGLTFLSLVFQIRSTQLPPTLEISEGKFPTQDTHTHTNIVTA